MTIQVRRDGKVLQPWEIRAGLLVTETRYAHDAREATLTVVDPGLGALVTAFESLIETAEGMNLMLDAEFSVMGDPPSEETEEIESARAALAAYRAAIGD